MRKQQVLLGADGSKWCESHRSYSHTKKDCNILRYQIECLVRQGLLDKYIAWRRTSRSRDKETRKRQWRSHSRRRQTPKTSNEEEPKNWPLGDPRNNILHCWRRRNKFGKKKAPSSYHGCGIYFSSTTENIKPGNLIL